MVIDSSIFKAYDIRGLYPGEINEVVVRQIGRAYVAYLSAERIGVSRDMRVSSPALADAFIHGAREHRSDSLHGVQSPEQLTISFLSQLAFFE